MRRAGVVCRPASPVVHVSAEMLWLIRGIDAAGGILFQKRVRPDVLRVVFDPVLVQERHKLLLETDRAVLLLPAGEATLERGSV